MNKTKLFSLLTTATLAIAIIVGTISYQRREATGISSPLPSQTPVPSINTDDDKKLILRDLTKAGLTCNDSCQVQAIVADYAKGVMPMGYWIARYTEGVWKIVITGNGIPSCSEVDAHAVPREIYGNCIESTKELRFTY